MQEILTTVITLSIIAAITPGPLMALLLSETLKHGKASGIKIALAPLFTDLPIMLVGTFILSKLSQLNILLGLISLFGSIYLAYLAYGSIKTKSVNLETREENRSLRKGIISNFLNPNPYIFYFSILGPLVVKGMKINFLLGPICLAIFLGFFVLFMILIVLSVHYAKDFFSSKKYIYVIRILGVILLYFAFTFFLESLKYFGLI